MHYRLINALVALALLLAPVVAQPAAAHPQALALIDPSLSLLKDINPGDGVLNMSGVIQYGSKVFFFGNDGIHGLEPWISDGTAAGTYMIKDILLDGNGVYFNPWSTIYRVVSPVVWNGKVYFVGTGLNEYNYPDPQLWVSDGTFSGTHAVTTDYHPIWRIIAGTQGIIFQDMHIDSEVNLWWSDGTAQKTYELYTWKGGDSLYDFQELNGAVYIVDPTNNFFKVNIATREQVLIKSGDNFPTYSLIGAANGLLFLWGYTPETGGELWQSDGTPQGTEIVADLTPGPGSTDIYDHLIVNNSLFFTAANQNKDVAGLYKTNEKANGVTPLTSNSHSMFDLTLINGILFFTERDQPNYRFLPWRSDGTPEGTWPMCTTCLHDRGVAENGMANQYVGTTGKILYTATDAMGSELWSTDGSDDGTHRLADLYPGVNGSNPRNLVAMNGYVFFVANDGVHGFEPWIYRPGVNRMVTHLDTLTTETNTAAPIDVVSNDAQLDSKPLYLTGFDATSFKRGTITRDERGTPGNLADDRLIYTPLANYRGPDEFTYTIEDGSGAVTSGRVRIDVYYVNQPPVFTTQPLAFSAPENGQADFPFTWQDPEGDMVSAAITQPPSHGTASLINCSSTACTLHYQPAANYAGTDSVTIQIMDSPGLVTTGTFNIYINQPPAFTTQPLAFSVTEDGQADFPFNWQEPDGETVTVTIAQQAKFGMASLVNCSSSPCTLHYQPSANYAGSDSVTIQLKDSFGMVTPGTFNITVDQGNNDPPFMVQPGSMMVYSQVANHAMVLNGISAGPFETEPVNITAETDNPALLTDLTVDYVSGTQGWLTFTLGASAEPLATVTLTLNDEVNQSQYTFTVRTTDLPPQYLPFLSK